jgi:predicted transcriptional regulator of viral defense system
MPQVNCAPVLAPEAPCMTNRFSLCTFIDTLYSCQVRTRGQLEPDPGPVIPAGILRARDLAAAGISRQSVAALAKSGRVLRVSRGVYVSPDHPLTEKHSIAVACTRVPGGVISLMSALVFHGLTDHNPFEVWMTIAPAARRPMMDQPPLRVTRFSGAALAHGVETHSVEGARVRVYSVAKTVADLFKYRNKIGIDVAVQALREALQDRRLTIDDLVEAARVCRVERVITPYVEALQ